MERGRGSSSSSSSRPMETNKTVALKSEDPNKFPNIPEEIIIEILSRIRLPHDFFCRLRCVSKQLSSLINDSNLITLSKRQKVIVMYQMYESWSFTFQSIDQQCYVEKLQTPWEKNLDLRNSEVHIYGSCNGLFLLGIKVDLYLWNPLNGYFKKVLSYHRLTHRYLSSSVITSGLCYDSSTNGYKAVMALTSHDPCDCRCVMVGNFRRKYWKEVCFPFNISSIRSGPVLNGQLHWFACNTNFLSAHSIFSFDPLVDEFKKVPMPKPSKDGDEFILLGLGVLDGCLCMIRHRQSNVEVWVMEAYGVQNSWNVRFVINKAFRVCSMFEPLCCTKDGKVLLREHIGYDTGRVNVYNSNGDLDKDVPRPSDYNYSMVAMAYEESLVEPTDYTWENEERRGIATYVEHFLSANSRIMTKGKGDSKWHL